MQAASRAPDMRMRFRYGSRHRIQPLDGAVRKQCAAVMKQEGCNRKTVQWVQSPAETQVKCNESVSRRENDEIADDVMGSNLYSVRRKSGARLIPVSLGTPERIPVNVKRFPHKCSLKH